MLLSHSELKRLLHYDPETGIWTRLIATQRPIGSRADYPAAGYRRVSVHSRAYKAHRLAWFYMTGEWPPLRIDHKNGNPIDNVWLNLRPASDSQNGANSKLSKNSTTGLKGVCWDKSRNQFCATLRHKRKQLNLGRFDCPVAAHFAYLIAADICFGEFARAR